MAHRFLRKIGSMFRVPVVTRTLHWSGWPCSGTIRVMSHRASRAKYLFYLEQFTAYKQINSAASVAAASAVISPTS